MAITRAEKWLTLTHANSRYQYGQMRYNDVSRFVAEIPDENYDNITASAASKTGLSEPKLLGNFKPMRKLKAPKINAKDFKADPSSDIKEGMQVLHLKFGVGKVLSIDERKVATILFDQVVDSPEKRIMLQYAKLQILG